jgi:hypothetical protein
MLYFFAVNKFNVIDTSLFRASGAFGRESSIESAIAPAGGLEGQECLRKTHLPAAAQIIQKFWP